MANTWKLVLEYEGTRYSGWQEQRNARTVQGALREAVEGYLGERVDIGGAGRTDAGVHALAQVAHLRTNVKCKARDLLNNVNDRLPADVNLLSAEPVPLQVGFHARHDAEARTYLYQISTRRTAFGKRYVWWIKDTLDEQAMRQAADLVAGRHDFAAFSERSPDAGSTIVEVHESSLEREEHLLLYRITASHFLWKMVRRIVGALAAVGRGQMSPKDVEQLLGGHGTVAELTAPPSGLFLERVYYPGDE